MSAAENHTNDTDGISGTPVGPRPEPIRFFGTTWVDHSGGYAARRTGVAVGSLVVTVAAGFVLHLAYDGLRIAEAGSFVPLLIVVMFAICSSLAFRHTWSGFTTRHDPGRQASLRGLLAVGVLGTLLAYFFRSLVEAPGEKLHRAEYETARAEYHRRVTRRSGNPAKRRRRS